MKQIRFLFFFLHRFTRFHYLLMYSGYLSFKLIPKVFRLLKKQHFLPSILFNCFWFRSNRINMQVFKITSNRTASTTHLNQCESCFWCMCDSLRDDNSSSSLSTLLFWNSMQSIKKDKNATFFGSNTATQLILLLITWVELN